MYLVRWVDLLEKLYWSDPLPSMVRRELWRDYKLKAVVSNGVAVIPMKIGFRVLTPGAQEFVLTFESNEATVPLGQRSSLVIWTCRAADERDLAQKMFWTRINLLLFFWCGREAQVLSRTISR
jgi:hypothetical protein